MAKNPFFIAILRVKGYGAFKELTMISTKLFPAEFSESQAASFVSKSSIKGRKALGQFFTPLAVARFMAGLAEYNKKSLRVLDAGAGTGILSCAICEAAVKNKTVKTLEIDAYEIDPLLADLARESLQIAKKWLAQQQVELSFRIIEEDFIQSYRHDLWAKEIVPYDLTIGNPPYFKIGKNDPRAIAASRFVYGQPNIYALFMGVAAELLRDKGLMVMITPRSYASGPYFRLFRQRFFDMVSPERVHLFESRKDAFRKDEVLQENIILKARKAGKSAIINISVSKGIDDLSNPIDHSLSTSQVLYPAGKGRVLRLPVSDLDIEVIDMVEQWKGSLHKYGFEISTGPVVPFRAEDLISGARHGSEGFVPLIWMQNVHPMRVEWPCFSMKNGREKPQFIKANKEALRRHLILEDQNFVLLRRFSAKEQQRRLTAAPLIKGTIGSDLIGLENHVNYIYKPKGELSKKLALGLSAFLNSSLLDRYFRISNGNTQVSATEIRAMPLPFLQVIEEVGDAIKALPDIPTLAEIDNLVWGTINNGNEILSRAGGLSGG